MKLKTARHWLGIYFLVVSVFVGAYLLLFGGSSWLPLTPAQASASFQVIVPVLVGQLAIVFQWLSSAAATALDDESSSPIPDWAIVLPPVLSLFVFVLGVIALALSNAENASAGVSPATFQSVVTFSVTLLNASTVLLVGRLFPSARPTTASSENRG